MENITKFFAATSPAKNMELNFHVCNFYHDADSHDIVDIVTASLNWAFCIPAIFGNVLLLFAIRRTPSMGFPSKILLFSLALSDFLVGLIVQPSFALHKLLEHKLAACVVGFIYDFSSGHLSLVSLLTMVFISLDKFMALHLKLRYRAVVTYKRALIVVAIIWMISIPWSASYLFLPRLYYLLVISIIPLSFFITSVVFIQIYTVLRRQQNQLMAHSRKDSINMSLYRKSVTNMLYIYCALLVAYFPVWLVLLIRIIHGQTTKILQNATELGLLVVLINSTVNPMLCFWRIREIRVAAKDLLKNVLRTRSTIEDVGSTNMFNLETRIQTTDVGLKNCGPDDILVKDLEGNSGVSTTHL